MQNEETQLPPEGEDNNTGDSAADQVAREAATKTPEALATDAAQPPSEIEVVKARARLMGITFSNNIGIEALRAKIRDKQNGQAAKPDLEAAKAKESEPELESPNKVNALTGEPVRVKKLTLCQYLFNENMKLVRVRIQNLDPKKKDLHGEIITVANEHLGTVRKFVPYSGEAAENYHLPYILFNHMKGREFLNIRTVKVGNKIEIQQSWSKEFALEILPDLTQAELKQLATAQIAAGSVT